MTLQFTYTEDKVKAKIAKNERLIAQLTAKRNNHRRGSADFHYWQDKINVQKAISEALREVL